MKKTGVILGRFAAVLVLVFILFLLIADRFVQFRMDDADYTAFFSKQGLRPTIHYYKVKDRKIRYASIGSDTSATLFFIHGAPSSLSYYNAYLSDTALLNRATMFAVDRAGYGYSGLGKAEPSLEKQVELIVPVLDSLNKVHRPLVVVAASYGTSIACRLVMDHPELVDGLVLLAPSLAPGEEKVYWFTPYAESSLCNWVVPRMLQSANKEKINHKDELTKMLPYWSNIRVPVIYMQGSDDELIYTSNAAFAQSHLTNVPYLDIKMLPGRGHLIAFAEKKAITQSIIKMIGLAREYAEGDVTAMTNAKKNNLH